MDGLNVETFLGPCFVMLCVTFILYGLLCAQVYYYYTSYRDHIALKLVVLLLFLSISVLESLHVATSIHFLYSYLVVDYANPSKLLDIIWQLLIYLEHTGDPIVQWVWCVSRNKILLFALIAVQLTRVAVGFRATAFVCLFHTWDTLGAQKLFDVYLNATLAFSVLVDFSITFALTYYFTVKSRASAHAKLVTEVADGRLSQYRSTKKILLKLTYYAITAGALTVLLNIISLITYNKSKTTLTYFAILQIALKCKPRIENINTDRVTENRLNARKGIGAIHVLKETIVKGNKWEKEKYTDSSQSSHISGITNHVEIMSA
ncbi:hypothetical protein BDY19DRAFT_906379 [Irpex rosettiformis]|uniref:Uncharacterized protein n=1 Tax=Irpex rosettiformis TaxID=378272 RepID=A0ACB8U3S9_9APHY|nr:hypothetical protein BDY19DRAFT_906379 [Irpex rosettiformis]